MSHHALIKCGLNQIQFIINLQADLQDLRKWGTLMMSFGNFKTAWKVKIPATTQKGSFPAVLVYMVRGTFSNLYYPFAYFASTGFAAVQLYSCTIEATKVLMSLEFSVRAYVCDGALPNRKFFKLIVAGLDDDFYWEWYSVEKGNKIYMISDVPDLLKTTRNCLENSCCNKKARNVYVIDQNFYNVNAVFPRLSTLGTYFEIDPE